MELPSYWAGKNPRLTIHSGKEATVNRHRPTQYSRSEKWAKVYIKELTIYTHVLLTYQSHVQKSIPKHIGKNTKSLFYIAIHCSVIYNGKRPQTKCPSMGHWLKKKKMGHWLNKRWYTQWNIMYHKKDWRNHQIHT